MDFLRPYGTSSTARRRYCLGGLNKGGLLPALDAFALFNFPITLMLNHLKHFLYGAALLVGAITVSQAQTSVPAAPKSAPGGSLQTVQTVPTADSQPKSVASPVGPAAKT